MVKMKNVKMYDLADVPDHVIEEAKELCMILLSAMVKVTQDAPSNLVMSAMNFVHASYLMHLVSPDFVHEAAHNAAVGLIKNTEMMMREKGIQFHPFGEQ